MTKQDREILRKIEDELARRKEGNCPACNGDSRPAVSALIGIGTLPEGVQVCDDCNGIFTVDWVSDHIIKRIVQLGTLVEGSMEGARYFNVENAMGRSHGWMNEKGEVLQYG